MIPILYEANETDFTTLGIGPLADAIKCIVTEELNGAYELEMTYPVEGIHYSELMEDRIIYAVPFEGGRKQMFKIYQIEKPLNGEVIVRAEHIHYLLNKMVVMPFDATSVADAIGKIQGHIVDECPFTFTTDRVTEAEFKMIVPIECGKLLGGTEGSILDIFGSGDYEFDNFNVILHADRGTDNGITVRYGKNMTELNASVDTTNVYTGVIPFYKDTEDNVTYADGYAVWSDHKDDYVYPMAKVLDLSTEFDAEREAWEQEQSESETPSEESYKPSSEELITKATDFLTRNSGWNKNNNIKVSFVNLWQTEEYADMASLERVKMCDTVTVLYKKLGVSITKKVIKTEYNVLLDRYDSIELGTPSATLAKEVASTSAAIAKAATETKSWMDKAIEHATKLITGGLGGYVVINRNAAGKPNEILIMDTPSKATAVNVWRFNLNGLGHSHSGYNGPFDDVALTADGQINASMITAGELNANIIKAGIIQDQEGNFTLNMETGELVMENGTFKGNVEGATITAGSKTHRTRINGSNTSIEGQKYENNEWKVHNNIDPISSNNNRMIIDSDTGIEIRTPNLYIQNQSNPQTVEQCDNGGGVNFVTSVSKDYSGAYESNFLYSWVDDLTPSGSIYCTLPVWIKYSYNSYNVKNGMLTNRSSHDSGKF